MFKLLCFLAIKFSGKEGEVMMAMLFAQRVILGKTKFEEVPNSLKAQVAEIIKDSGLPELLPEEWR